MAKSLDFQPCDSFVASTKVLQISHAAQAEKLLDSQIVGKEYAPRLESTQYKDPNYLSRNKLQILVAWVLVKTRLLVSAQSPEYSNYFLRSVE